MIEVYDLIIIIIVEQNIIIIKIMKDGTLAEKIELADNIIKMKFGNRVKSNLCTAYLSNGVIGKVFGLSREKVR